MNDKPMFTSKTVRSLVCILLFCLYLMGCGGGGGGGGPAVQNNDQTIPGDSGLTIYVAGYHPQQPELGGVAAINGSSGAVTRLIRAAGNFQDIAVSPDGNYLYSTSDPRGVLKVNLNNTDDAAEIPLAPETGSNPTGLAVSPDGRWVYVTSNTTGYVSIIDTTTGEVVNTVKAGNLASDVAFTPDGRTAYVCSGDVYMIDTETQSLIDQRIDVGFRAYAVAIAE
jgi:YVTN family beta-propeller protein